MRFLFFLRLRGLPRAHVTIDDLGAAGFERLAEAPGRWIVFATVGRFWSLRAPRVPLGSEAFARFDEPGWAKAAVSFAVEPAGAAGSRIVTETRVRCTDERSRQAFRRYWLVVGPWSGLIRRLWLRQVRQAAERLA